MTSAIRATSASTQLCTFMLDELPFAVPVEHVQEVLRAQEITPVPLTPPVVAGLINLRGQIVTALDLRLRLGLEPRAADATVVHVVLQTPTGPVSFLVDDIGDVIDVEEALFEPTPPTLPAVLRAVVSGVYKLEDTLSLVLNVAVAATVEAGSFGHGRTG